MTSRLHVNYLYSAITILVLAGSWMLVYFTNGTSHAYVYSFIVAIVLGAWIWGPIGGAIVGTVSGVLLGPLMPLTVHPLVTQHTTNWVVRAVAFTVMGTLTGFLFHRLQKQKQQIQVHLSEIQESAEDLIFSLAHTIELRDPYTNGHCERVAKMGRQIGERLGLSETELMNLYMAGLIHDVGKIAIPETILNKPGKLTDFEFSVVKQHPMTGAWVLEGTQFGHLYRDGVISHHERFDGKGYPAGLSGTAIPLQGRILAVADAFDAISSDRPYRPRMPFAKCMQIMREGRGTQFDPEILDAFLQIASETEAIQEVPTENLPTAK